MKTTKKLIPLACTLLAWTAVAEPVKTVGPWSVDFDAKSSVLSVENAARKIRVAGPVSFAGKGATWRVVPSRDACRDRLCLARQDDVTLGYVSFRADGDRFALTVFRRAGAAGGAVTGVLSWQAKVAFREDSFACRTRPTAGERIVNFGDGAADASTDDSLFARGEDLALRFDAYRMRIRTLGGGDYAVDLAAEITEAAHATIALEADGAYFGSRWVPAYHPINRRRCPRAPTGWMSWNIYFDKAGSAENLAEARVGAKYLRPFGLEIWSIESWQDNSLWLPVSNFHHHENRCYKAQFPEGMKALADELRALGFRPGIWMSLYGEGDKAFYEAHKDLYLHDAKGQPINNWAGRYMLDTSKPEALALMTGLARQARNEWGYEFFKFDGMSNTPHKFEKPAIRARAAHPDDTKWFENSARALRAGIGEDALFLACMGDFNGTEIQFADATRLGSDVVGCYGGVGENYNPLGNSNYAQMPVKWHNVLHQARCTFSQVFFNNIIAYTDPDTLMVGYALEKNEAEVMATIVGLPGQLMFDGDRLGALKYDRMKIIQQVLPVADIHPKNLYPYPMDAMLPVWNLAVTRPFGSWNVVALFNWKDEPQDVSVTPAELGLDAGKDYVGYEFWKQENLGEIREGLTQRLPMRSVKLIALRERAARPQFVGDDRHVTQGAVELTDESWNAAAKTLTLKVNAIAGFPFAYAVRVPDGFAFAKAETAADGVTLSTKTEVGLVRVTVDSKTTQTVAVTLKF